MANGVNLGQLVNANNTALNANSSTKLNNIFNTGDGPVATLGSMQNSEALSQVSKNFAASNAFSSMIPQAISNNMPGLSGLGMGGTDILSTTDAIRGISPFTSSADILSNINKAGIPGADNMPLLESIMEPGGAAEDESFFVTITSQINTGRYVRFNTMPVVSESRSVQYQTLSPVHMPGTYQVYENTNSRTFSISDLKLISRNSTEASLNLNILKTLRGWTMPFFGQNNDKEVKDYFGAPPEPLFLTAYSKDKNRGHIYKVSVVLQNLDITYPNDCDYIATPDGTPMPIIMPISSLVLAESHSAFEYEQFDLSLYRTGNLTYF